MTSPTKLCMIIRNISVVLVIYDYFSVVVCQCQLHQISVPSCPSSPHEWSLKAREICTMKDKYHCLITENHNEDIPDLIECCMPYKNISRGHMPRYNTFKKTIQEIACDHGYYMTTTFASNRYRLNGVEHCHYKKSACVMEGMKIYDNRNTTEDRKCYCDYKNNFKPDLSLDPNVFSFYEKDNDCIMSECDLEFQEMNMIYQCVNLCKDGEYRPERSMDCIPKSSTTTPPVVVSINGSIVIKTSLQTPTKSTKEKTFEPMEPTDTTNKIIVPLLAVVVIVAIICYIVKTCKDRNRNTYNIHNAHNVIIGSRNVLQENDSASKPEEVSLIEVAPGQPRNIDAKVLSPKRIEVSWLPPTDSANISYNVYFNDSSVMEHPNNNYVLEDLIPDTVYHIQVSATSNGGEGEKSTIIDVKTSPLVPIIELKGHAFIVDEGKSVAIECNINYEQMCCQPFWERINENDETNKLTIREDKKDKYFGLKRDPPCLTILNAEMSDGGYYCCCIEYSTSNGEETVRSKKAHLIVEEAVKPGDTYIEKLVKIKANDITADIIYVGGDGKNITVKNTSEDKKEKPNTSSENETSSNIDKTEQGTQNSDCGQETGDVDINEERKSKLKPVSVTEQKNICISNIEKIAVKHGFSVKNVRSDGNCMFHAIALQLLGNKLKSKIGEEKSKELRCKIVEFLKNNDTTPTGEKYSSFLSSVHENERESRWSTYLASMSKPGTPGDKIVLRAVSHCFNVHIDVLSTASPERFIKYNSPDNSEDSTVYLGFIDKLSHYVRLQPKLQGTKGHIPP